MKKEYNIGLSPKVYDLLTSKLLKVIIILILISLFIIFVKYPQYQSYKQTSAIAGTSGFILETIGEVIGSCVFLYFVFSSSKNKEYPYWCKNCKKGFKTLKEANNHKC
jgi:hypothetical protein